MNKNRFIIISLATMLILACAVSTSPQAQPPVEQPPVVQATYTALPTYTPYPTDAAVVAASPTTAAPTSAPQSPAVNFTVSQWSGTLLQPWGSRINMTLIVLKVNGNTFSGKMSWRISECTALMALKGEIITDINTASEQNRWSQHPDFSSDKGGAWLKWTQTENQGDPNCYINSGDWWYAHVGSNNHLTAIRFMNDTDPAPANGGLDLTKDN